MSYDTIETDKVFVSFQCGDACTNVIFRVHVSDLILTGPPVCPDCDEICDPIDDLAELER